MGVLIMSPILDIIMPHYNEPWEEGKKFFSMLDLQRDADFSKVCVIFVQDGPENTIDDSCFLDRPYEVRRIMIPHGGVSAARNAGLKASTADFVMFCDFDDMFSNVYALRDILNVLNPNYDVLWTEFISEDKMASGSMHLHIRGRNLVFIHGKVYRRQFLLDNDLWFDPALKFNEDSCFNAIANTIVDYRRTGQIKTMAPLYIWCYREGSATTSPDHQGQALLGLYERNKRVCEAFRKRLSYDRYCAMVARTIWDTYHSCNVDDPGPEQLQIIDDFKAWYAERRECWALVDAETMKQIRQISQAEHERGDQEAEARWNIEHQSRFREDISIDAWLKSLEQEG